MLIYCSFIVKYGTRPVRDVVIMHNYGKIHHLSRRGCCFYEKVRLNTAPVQSELYIYCSIMMKYGTRPVEDVVILQCYSKKKTGTRQVTDDLILQ